MAPINFFLFTKLKLPLPGTRLQSIEDIKEDSRRELKSIPENAFKNCFDSVYNMNNINNSSKNFETFLWKKGAFDCARIRAQVFRMAVDYSDH